MDGNPMVSHHITSSQNAVSILHQISTDLHRLSSSDQHLLVYYRWWGVHDGVMAEFARTGLDKSEFVKSLPHADGEIDWEVAGLSWLAQADGAPVVRVFRHDHTSLVEQRLVTVSATRSAARQFGEALSITHSAGAASFGAPPPDWPVQAPGWIGRLRLALGEFDHWGEFYARLRLEPYVRAGRDAGQFSADQVKLFDRVCDRLVSGDFDDQHSPARIHGDLWSGNALFTADGVTMIDPAAHGGHRLTDLAMLDLFGFPFFDDLWDAYREAAGITQPWCDLLPLHQLHPLLVHTVLFGGGYGDSAYQIARRYSGIHG